MKWYILFKDKKTGKYPYSFGKPKEKIHPRIKLRFFNALTRFNIDDNSNRGILEKNPLYEGNTNAVDPNERYPFIFYKKGYYIESPREFNFADEAVSNHDFWGQQFDEDYADTSEINSYKAPLEVRSTWQSINPNIILNINRHEGEVTYITKTVRWSNQYTNNGIYKFPPWGSFYLKTDSIDGFITPDGENANWDNVMGIYLQSLNPGLYSLGFSTGIEASGGVGTTNRPTGGAIIAGSEYEYFESVDNIFFSPWDLSDRDTYKVTTNPYYNGDEIVDGPFLKIDEKTFQQWDIYLVPRRWLYYFQFVATYIVVTMFTFWYMNITYAGTFYDKPPWYPYPFGYLELESPLTGFCDYGCYYKLINSDEFKNKEILSKTYSYANPFFAIIWMNNSNYYFRVRCTPDKVGHLCAIIIDKTGGERKYYIWRKIDENRELITMVDSMVFYI